MILDPENALKQVVLQLLGHGMIAPEELDALVEEQSESGRDFLDLLVFSGKLDPRDLCWIFSQVYELPLLPKLDVTRVVPEDLTLLPARLVREARVLPLHRQEGALAIASYRPLEDSFLAELRRITGFEPMLSLTTVEELDAAILQLLGRELHQGGETARHFRSITLASDLLDRFEGDYSCDHLFDLLLETLTSGRAERITVDHLGRGTRIGLLRNGEPEELLEIDADWTPAFLAKLQRGFELSPTDLESERLLKTCRLERTEKVLELHLHYGLVSNGAVYCFGPRLEPTDLPHDRTTPTARTMLRRAVRHGGLVLLCGNRRGLNEHYLHQLLVGLSCELQRLAMVGPDLQVASDRVMQCSVPSHRDEDLVAAIDGLIALRPEAILVTSFNSEAFLRYCLERSFTGMPFLVRTSFPNARDLLHYLAGSALNRDLLALNLQLVHGRLTLPGLCPHCRQEVVPDRELERFFDGPLEHNLWTSPGCDRCQGGHGPEPVVLEESVQPTAQLRAALADHGQDLEVALKQCGCDRLGDNLRDLVKEGFLDVDLLHRFG